MNNYEKLLINAINKGKEAKVIENILHLGANPNLTFQRKLTCDACTTVLEEWSLLDSTILYNHIETVELLLKYGADPNSGHWCPIQCGGYITRYTSFYSVLSEAIIKTNNVDMVKLLLNYGANPNYVRESYDVQPLGHIQGRVGWRYGTIIHTALSDLLAHSYNTDMMKLLLTAGADPDSCYKYVADNPKKDDLEVCSIPVLDIAVKQNNFEAIQLLLEAGASLDKYCYIQKKFATNAILVQLKKENITALVKYGNYLEAMAGGEHYPYFQIM